MSRATDMFIAASNVDIDAVRKEIELAEAENRIPKIIHFCWCSDELDPIYESMMDSWTEYMPDYIYIRWTDKMIPENDFIKKSLDMKKYAFVADCARIYALYNYGGFYLDCDVVVHKRFDDLLKYPYVIPTENARSWALGVPPQWIPEMAILGAVPKLNLFKILIDVYDKSNFSEEDFKAYFKCPMPVYVRNVLVSKYHVDMYFRVSLEEYDRLFNEGKLLNNNTLYFIDTDYIGAVDPNYPLTDIVKPVVYWYKDIDRSKLYASHQLLSNWRVK